MRTLYITVVYLFFAISCQELYAQPMKNYGKIIRPKDSDIIMRPRSGDIIILPKQIPAGSNQTNSTSSDVGNLPSETDASGSSSSTQGSTTQSSSQDRASNLMLIEYRLREDWNFQEGRISSMSLDALQLNAVETISSQEKARGSLLSIEAYNVLMDKLKILTQQSVLGEEFSTTDITKDNTEFINNVFEKISIADINKIDASEMEQIGGEFFYPIINLTVTSTNGKAQVTIDGMDSFSSETEFTHPFEGGKVYMFNFKYNGHTMTRKVSTKSSPKNQYLKLTLSN